MKRLPVTLVVLLSLVGCRPLYLPPVPAPLELQERLEVQARSTASGGVPVLEVRLQTVPTEGWLAVQWFSPENREVASASVWLEPEDEGRVLTLTLPEDIEMSEGRWRAVLSFAGAVVRQVSSEVATTAN